MKQTEEMKSYPSKKFLYSGEELDGYCVWIIDED
jgi:hypothetical protein